MFYWVLMTFLLAGPPGPTSIKHLKQFDKKFDTQEHCINFVKQQQYNALIKYQCVYRQTL